MLYINKNKLLSIKNKISNTAFDLICHKKNIFKTKLTDERNDWEKLLLSILSSLLPYFKNENTLISFYPNKTSISGKKSDGYELFARSFLGFSLLMSNLDIKNLDKRSQNQINKLLNNYSTGIKSGTNIKSKNYWGNIKSVQKNCESGLLALGLLILEKNNISLNINKKKIILFFNSNIKEKYKNNNWLWFRMWQSLYLYKNKYLDKNIIEGYYNEIEKLYDDKTGWYKDGAKNNHLDYYNAWGFHFYNLCFNYLFKNDFSSICDANIKKYNKFWKTYKYFVPKNGKPMFYGRSLIYRFASISPLALSLENSNEKIAYTKNIIKKTINNFLDNNLLDNRGLISFGYYDKFINMSEIYSGSGSPYWCLKGFSCLLLPNHHPFWKVNTNGENEDTKNILTITDKCIIYKNKLHTILLNGNSTNARYIAKYNKFAYSNIFASDINEKFPIDNNLIIKKGFKKLFRTHNTSSKIENNNLFFDWGNKNIIVKTTITPIKNGYNIKHQVTCNKLNCKLLHGGFPLPSKECKAKIYDNKNDFKVVKSNISSNITINKIKGVDFVKFKTLKNKNKNPLNKYSFIPLLVCKNNKLNSFIDIDIFIKK